MRKEDFDNFIIILPDCDDKEKLKFLTKIEAIIEKDSRYKEYLYNFLKLHNKDNTSVVQELLQIFKEKLHMGYPDELKESTLQFLVKRNISGSDKLRLCKLIDAVDFQTDGEVHTVIYTIKNILDSHQADSTNINYEIFAISAFCEPLEEAAEIMSKVVLCIGIKAAGIEIMQNVINAVKDGVNNEVIESILEDFNYIAVNQEELKKNYEIEDLYKMRFDYWLNCASLIKGSNIDVANMTPLTLKLYRDNEKYKKYQTNIFEREYSK